MPNCQHKLLLASVRQSLGSLPAPPGALMSLPLNDTLPCCMESSVLSRHREDARSRVFKHRTVPGGLGNWNHFGLFVKRSVFLPCWAHLKTVWGACAMVGVVPCPCKCRNGEICIRMRLRSGLHLYLSQHSYGAEGCEKSTFP